MYGEIKIFVGILKSGWSAQCGLLVQKMYSQTSLIRPWLIQIFLIQPKLLEQIFLYYSLISLCVKHHTTAMLKVILM